MKYCETCGVNPRFREINAEAYETKVEKLESKYKLNLEQARKANLRLRTKLDSQRYIIQILRDKVC